MHPHRRPRAGAVKGADHSVFHSEGKASSRCARRVRSRCHRSCFVLGCSATHRQADLMQLNFELEASPLLPRLRDALLGLFEPQRPRSQVDPLSQLILSIIGARTFDEASHSAFVRLRGVLVDWSELAMASPKRIETAIAAVAFAERKAR